MYSVCPSVNILVKKISAMKTDTNFKHSLKVTSVTLWRKKHHSFMHSLRHSLLCTPYLPPQWEGADVLVPYLILSYLILTYNIVSCLILSYLILSLRQTEKQQTFTCLILSYLSSPHRMRKEQTFTCLILSYLILSYLDL